MALDKLVNKNMDNALEYDILHKWDHMVSTIGSSEISVKELDLSEADKYIFDFNGLLNSLNVPEKYWYPHVRLNNFKSSTDYDGRTSILLLDSDFLNTIYNAYSNKSKIL